MGGGSTGLTCYPFSVHTPLHTQEGAQKASEGTAIGKGGGCECV